jgi:hypothetical protein
MKTALLAACGAAALVSPALAETLSIEDYAGRIQIQTGDYPELEIEVIPGESGAAPVVSRNADGVTVEGDWNPEGFWASADNGGQCRGDGAQREIRLERGGRHYRVSELPLIRVTAPRGVNLEIDDSLIDGEAGDLGAASIGLAGCSALDVASVAGAMDVDMVGVGNLRIGDIGGRLDADVAGAGEMDVGAVNGGAEIDIAGAGDMEIAHISGSVDADLAGAGNHDP